MEICCKITKEIFIVNDEDLLFYKKMGVPTPTIAPDERARKRMSFANQRFLFHRNCSGSGKKILSNYPPESKIPIYDIEYWYSDKWNMFETGRNYDFNHPFFEQFLDLMKVAPRPNLQRAPQFDDNSDFTNYAGKNKNCYLIFDSDISRDCFYSYSINTCTDVVDCYRVDHSELCYECVDCTRCYNSTYLQNSENCRDSSFLKNCNSCSECFACVNLANKKYCFFNEQLSKEDYFSAVKKLNLSTYEKYRKFKIEFLEYAKQFPQRYMQGVMNEDCIGDYLTNCKNAISCFDSRELWDCKYVAQSFDDAKDCMDCTEIGDKAELLYESCYVGYSCNNLRFSTHCLGQTSNMTYCYYCPTSADCFGCIGLHHAKYCILNKQYSKEAYEEKVAQIIAHMTQTKEWGEFFPEKVAPFPYNLTHAFEHYPLTKDEALAKGYTWYDKKAEEYKESNYILPEEIGQVDDEICKNILSCQATKKNYKIQKPELLFYRKMNLPVPFYCFDQRHEERMKLRNKRKLYQRKCSACNKDILSSLDPTTVSKVLCAEDFLHELY